MNRCKRKTISNEKNVEMNNFKLVLILSEREWPLGVLKLFGSKPRNRRGIEGYWISQGFSTLLGVLDSTRFKKKERRTLRNSGRL